MIGPSTEMVLPWLLNTKTFVKVMLPELQTDPPKTTELPAVTWPVGQLSVMEMAGMVRIGQVALAVLVTGWLFQTTMLFNVTLPVLLTVPEKVSNWPGETGCAEHTLVTLMPGVFNRKSV